MTDNDETADKLRNLDLLAWDETERYLSRFAEDLEYAPQVVDDLLTETACLGRTFGMEVEFPPLVAALTFVRLMAGGDEVFEKHQPIWLALMRSQNLDPQAKPHFERFCREIEANKLDPSTGEETLYRRGDPLERAKHTEQEKKGAKTEALLGKILEATEGWNCRDAFGEHWTQWTELWANLLREEDLARTLSRKCPNSSSNSTTINMTLVCNVAGLLKRHLGSQKHDVLSYKQLADLIEEKWSSSQCRKELDNITKLSKEQASQIKGWLAMNVR